MREPQGTIECAATPPVLRAFICHPDSTDLLLYASLVAEYGLAPELIEPASAADLLARFGIPALVICGYAPTDPRSQQLFAALRRYGRLADVPMLVLHDHPLVVEAWQRASPAHNLVVLETSASPRAVRQAIALLTGRESRQGRGLEDARAPIVEPEDAANSHAPRALAQPERSWKAALEFVLDELNVPVCVLSLREGERRRIIGAAQFDMTAGEDALLESFVRVVEDANEPLIVPDAATHPLFERHPFIRAGLVRGYAGLPLPGEGERGAVCVFDSKPLRFGAAALERAAGKVTQIAKGGAAQAGLRSNGDDPDAILLMQTLETSGTAPSFPLTLALVKPEGRGQTQRARPVRELAVDLRDAVRENDIVVAGRQDAVLLLLSVREGAAQVALTRLSNRLQQSGIAVRIASTEVNAGERMSDAVARARRSFRARK